MRWIADVKGCFYTCSCPDDLRVQFTLNLLRLVVKHWGKFVTTILTHAERAVVTWERFLEMFREEYVPLVEREWMAQEYMSLRQTTKTVTEINKLFHERALFCPNYASID